MSPRNDSQNEKIREERKQQILNVALEVFADNGFSSTSIAKIAQKAGISKGLIYNYFESKEELVTSIMIDGFRVMTESFDKDRDGVLTENELHYFIDTSFATLEENIPFWRMYFMVLLQPEVYKLITPQLETILGPFMQTALTYFVNHGYEDPEAELRFFSAMMDGVGLHFILDPENFPIEAVKKKMHNLFKTK
ncbi:TetR/AcrR family transcriptional regulator [Carboxylicivirga sp. N1Y90]|uniref:TetR/AcrR family transcriptional regulator n=1 Tax=Carboxylicivirga fragile TaxID=3417571 RepID=UPI003D3471CC|nr:TetR/AcrR family transcriptional regulator [Marinilabiliaceae bacterium N1Y90]